MSEAFRGGESMVTKLRKTFEKLGLNASVRVGFLRGSTCGKDGTADAPSVAYFNEVGTIGRQTLDTFEAVHKAGTADRTSMYHIPPRPFFRMAIDKHGPYWGRLLRAALKATDNDSKQALTMVGMKIQEQIQESIEEFTTPENAPSTATAKGFNKPLEDSKNMKRAVNFEVYVGQGGEV